MLFCFDDSMNIRSDYFECNSAALGNYVLMKFLTAFNVLAAAGASEANKTLFR